MMYANIICMEKVCPVLNLIFCDLIGLILCFCRWRTNKDDDPVDGVVYYYSLENHVKITLHYQLLISYILSC